MPRTALLRETPVIRTPRVQQLEGIFDLAPAERSRETWTVDMPIEDRPWSIGLIVGPSGCGKSTILRECFPASLVRPAAWSPDHSLLDDFPASMSIKDIIQLLSSVGFSSPPAWLRPFNVLSNGEQFRVTVARALAETPDLLVLDEFTSLVDRTVAATASAAISKAIRRNKRQLIVASCHYDVEDWLDPDWVYLPATGEFVWRCLRGRPPIELTIQRVHRSAWRLFAHHHYLSATIHPNARCYLASWHQVPVAFASVISDIAGPKRYREHRTVCLPDYQGVGIGNALSAYIASCFTALGCRYNSTTGNPAMVRHRAASPDWRMIRKPSRSVGGTTSRKPSLAATQARLRYTASFEYCGPPAPRDEAEAMIHGAP